MEQRLSLEPQIPGAADQMLYVNSLYRALQAVHHAKWNDCSISARLFLVSHLPRAGLLITQHATFWSTSHALLQ